jgi:hypothetical protein
MSPGTGDRFAALVERRLAGLVILAETEELSGLLERTEGARTLYLGAVELHVDLGSDLVSESSLNVAKEMDPMARMALNCSCGWNFFIPGTTTGLDVTCPSCAQLVRIPGRKPGRDVPMSPGEIAAEMQRRQGMIRMVVGAAAALLVAGLAYAAWPPAQPHSSYSPPIPVVTPAPPPYVPIPPTPSTPPDSTERHSTEPPPPIFTPAQIGQLKSGALEKVWMINMSTVIAEVLRLRNKMEPYEQLQTDIARYEIEIRHSLAELQKAGGNHALVPYFTKGDKIINFNGTDFRTMKPGEAAQLLHNWTIDWNAGPAIDQAGVSHNGKERTITLMFPEDPKELKQLLHHPALEADKLPNGRASDRIVVPSDLLAAYQSKIDVLPRGYLNWIHPVDQQRLNELLARKMGSSDDIDWLQKRVMDEILAAFQREYEGIRQKIRELEPMVKDNPAPDAVYLKDRQRIDGKVIEEGSEKVRVKLRKGAMLLSIEDIDRIERGKGVGMDVPGKFEAAKGNLEKLMSTLTWCDEKHLTVEKQYAACQILLLDPTIDKARSALGLPRRTIPGPK